MFKRKKIPSKIFNKIYYEITNLYFVNIIFGRQVNNILHLIMRIHFKSLNRIIRKYVAHVLKNRYLALFVRLVFSSTKRDF